MTSERGYVMQEMLIALGVLLVALPMIWQGMVAILRVTERLYEQVLWRMEHRYLHGFLRSDFRGSEMWKIRGEGKFSFHNELGDVICYDLRSGRLGRRQLKSIEGQVRDCDKSSFRGIQYLNVHQDIRDVRVMISDEGKIEFRLSDHVREIVLRGEQGFIQLPVFFLMMIVTLLMWGLVEMVVGI